MSNVLPIFSTTKIIYFHEFQCLVSLAHHFYHLQNPTILMHKEGDKWHINDENCTIELIVVQSIVFCFGNCVHQLFIESHQICDDMKCKMSSILFNVPSYFEETRIEFKIVVCEFNVGMFKSICLLVFFPRHFMRMVFCLFLFSSQWSYVSFTCRNCRTLVNIIKIDWFFFLWNACHPFFTLKVCFSFLFKSETLCYCTLFTSNCWRTLNFCTANEKFL